MPNPNYTHTVTLYNRLRPADTEEKKEIWKRTVLTGCFYKAETVQVQEDTRTLTGNTYTVRIPVSPDYRPYAAWKDGCEGFTVSEGDLVIYGECTEEITGTDGKTASRLLLRHKPGAFRIASFSDNSGFPKGRHYRIGG